MCFAERCGFSQGAIFRSFMILLASPASVGFSLILLLFFCFVAVLYAHPSHLLSRAGRCHPCLHFSGARKLDQHSCQFGFYCAGTTEHSALTFFYWSKIVVTICPNCIRLTLPWLCLMIEFKVVAKNVISLPPCMFLPWGQYAEYSWYNSTN